MQTTEKPCSRPGCPGRTLFDGWETCSKLCEALLSEFDRLERQLSRTTSEKRRTAIHSEWVALVSLADAASDFTKPMSQRRAHEVKRLGKRRVRPTERKES